MKLNYYGYSLSHGPTGHAFRRDLRPFLAAFVAFDNQQFKESFVRGDEHLYLLRAGENLYFFLTTRDSEIVKKIRRGSLELSEVRAMLRDDESLGFTSYVYVRRSSFAFASTIMAPRFGSFVDFVNDIYRLLNLSDFKFVAHPLIELTTREEVTNMAFVGRSTVQVNQNSPFYDRMRGMLGGAVDNFANVDAFEITIKPRKNKDIARAVGRMLGAASDAGLDKMIVKARMEDDGPLVDLYLAGKGIVSDQIDPHAATSVRGQIISKINGNAALRRQVIEHEQSARFRDVDARALARLDDVGAWAGALRYI